MNKAPCQRSHGLRFEPGTAANRTAFKEQGHTDRTKGARTKAGVILEHLSQMAALILEWFRMSYIGCSTSCTLDHSKEAL